MANTIRDKGITTMKQVIIHSAYFNFIVKTNVSGFSIVNICNGFTFDLTFRTANSGFKDKTLSGMDCAINFINHCYANSTLEIKEFNNITAAYLPWFNASVELAQVLNITSYSYAALLREAIAINYSKQEEK